MPDALQQLLQWSTQQTAAAQSAASSTSTAVTVKPEASPETSASTSTAAAPAPQQKLDTAILDHIMGKSEAVMMRDKLAIMVDQEQDLNERIMAMDDFEMVSGGKGIPINPVADKNILAVDRINRQCRRYAEHEHVAKSSRVAHGQAGSHHQARMLDLRHSYSE